MPSDHPSDGGFRRTGPHPCGYFPERLADSEYFAAARLSGREYEELMSKGWRRSGRIVYRPRCPDCRLCLPIRVDVRAFALRPSHRRCRKRNRDIDLSLSPALDDPEAIELYARYQAGRHGSSEPIDPDDTKSFLADSCVEGLLSLYRLEGRLVGAGWLDLVADGLSSVYFAFDPAESKRSLGVYSLLAEIDLARRLGLRWLYMGFLVPGSPTMDYKRRYRPMELLVDGEWRADPDDAWIDALAAGQKGQPSVS